MLGLEWMVEGRGKRDDFLVEAAAEVCVSEEAVTVPALCTSACSGADSERLRDEFNSRKHGDFHLNLERPEMMVSKHSSVWMFCFSRVWESSFGVTRISPVWLFWGRVLPWHFSTSIFEILGKK